VHGCGRLWQADEIAIALGKDPIELWGAAWW
jgi:hypothetical protein